MSETKLSGEALLQEIDRLRSDKAKLQAELEAKSERKALTFKVGEKGGVSVYGLGRFPVTLYAGQWEALLERVDDLRAFIKANSHRLSHKE